MKYICDRYKNCEKTFECEICGHVFVRNSLSKVCSLKCRVKQGSIKLENGCWEWVKMKAGDYGKLRWNGKTISAHRASYIAFKGDIKKGLWVLHSCDNPCCVNPEHLSLGTPKDNHDDMHRKKRGIYRDKNHFGRYTEQQIEEMKKLKDEGFTYERLTRIFNCSTTHVYNVIKGKYNGL